MDDDDAAPYSPSRRPSAPHDRPSRAPFGPRIRTRQKHSSPDPDAPASPLFSRPESPSAFSIDPYLAHTAHPDTPYPLSAHADAAVQAPSTPPPSSSPLPARSPSPSSPSLLPPSPSPSPPPPTSAPTHASKPTLSKSTPTTFIAPPPLTPPPALTFESTPIPWKGLPLEVAQWTFSSDELQEIVSTAIRLSARESFVRLLSPQALHVDIVQEQERLDAERAAAQAKWRFEAGRRTMLMQALNAMAASSAPNGLGPDPDGGNPILGFVAQLASSVASCDSLLSSILHFSDQQSQIEVIQHQHWASALGIALRKLNRAHERQAQELRRAQARVQTLEDELEEAWREAENMAIEFDDLEQEVAASDTEDGSECLDVEDAGMDADATVHACPDTAKQDVDETGTLGDVTINTDIAVVLGVTATAVASKATLVTSAGSPKAFDRSDTKSIRSVKSTRSRRSIRDGQSHVSRMSAARTRSRTASNASLRLPKSLRSPPSTHTSPVDAPPMPALPPSSIPGHSFLDMDNTTPRESVQQPLPPKRRPEPTIALPTPPHSAGLPPTRVPSIWLETEDGDKTTRLNGLDRTHSLHIFSSLTARTPTKSRRSNLVMSLTGSDESGAGSSEGGVGVGAGVGSAAHSRPAMDLGTGNSPTSNSSPVSLPTHALAHFRGPSLTSSMGSAGATGQRPGSAGARLTTAMDTRTPMPMGTPKRSLVSRASSVILRRLSQATTMGHKASLTASGGGGRKGTGASSLSPMSSPSRSREALRLSGGRERWRGRGSDVEEEEGEGEVMLIGSAHSPSLDGA